MISATISQVKMSTLYGHRVSLNGINISSDWMAEALVIVVVIIVVVVVMRAWSLGHFVVRPSSAVGSIFLLDAFPSSLSSPPLNRFGW